MPSSTAPTCVLPAAMSLSRIIIATVVARASFFPYVIKYRSNRDARQLSSSRASVSRSWEIVRVSRICNALFCDFLSKANDRNVYRNRIDWMRIFSLPIGSIMSSIRKQECGRNKFEIVIRNEFQRLMLSPSHHKIHIKLKLNL